MWFMSHKTTGWNYALGHPLFSQDQKLASKENKLQLKTLRFSAQVQNGSIKFTSLAKT